MRDVAINVESLGTKPGSIITSIAAVEFDALSGEYGSTFEEDVDVLLSEDAGFTMDWLTVHKWIARPEPDRFGMIYNGDKLENVLARLSDFYCEINCPRVWVVEPSVTVPLLNVAFEKLKVDNQLEGCAIRDIATVCDLANIDRNLKAISCNPIDDAKAQAAAVIEAYRSLRCDKLVEAAAIKIATAYLSTTDVAKRYGVTEYIIGRWTKDEIGEFPRPVDLLGKKRWRLSDLVAYEATLKPSGSESAA